MARSWSCEPERRPTSASRCRTGSTTRWWCRATWRQRVAAQLETTAIPTFVGSPVELEALRRALVRRSAPARLRLVAPGEGAALDCETVRGAPLVTTRPEQHLLDCAARGAHLIVVADPRATALGGGVGEHHQPWGRGSAALAPTLDDAAALCEAAPRVDDLPAMASPGGRWRERRQPPHQEVVIAALGGYLALVVVCGILVGRRSRRPLVAWGWFPLVAVTATAAVSLAGGGWDREVARLELLRTSVLAPSGGGSEWSSARIEALAGRIHSLRLPWREPRLAQLVSRPRFGSPFSRGVGPPRLIEDPQRGTLEIDDLTTGAGVGSSVGAIVATHRRPAVRVERRTGALWLVNDSGRPIAGATFWSSEGSARLRDWGSGEARPVEAASFDPGLPDRLPPETLESGGRIDPGTFLLVATGTEEPPPELRLDPPLPIVARWVEVVRGPLP